MLKSFLYAVIFSFCVASAHSDEINSICLNVAQAGKELYQQSKQTGSHKKGVELFGVLDPAALYNYHAALAPLGDDLAFATNYFICNNTMDISIQNLEHAAKDIKDACKPEEWHPTISPGDPNRQEIEECVVVFLRQAISNR